MLASARGQGNIMAAERDYLTVHVLDTTTDARPSEWPWSCPEPASRIRWPNA